VNALTFILRGAAHYWRTHVGVVLGTALASMVLVGSLLVGDSVRATLRQQALQRVGSAEAALTAGDRFFRAALADDTGQGAAPVLMVPGSAARTDGSARINQAQVLGVDARFWEFAPEPGMRLEGENIALNTRAATQLGIQPGDAIVLRVEKPGAFSRDAPLSGEEGEVVAIRAVVAAIVPDERFGRFSLAASQVAPFTVFVPLEYLQERLAFSGRANLLVARQSAADLSLAIREKWTLEDAALELRELPAGAGWELRSPRVFLDETILEAAPKGLPVLTYLVNELRAGEKATPYSMVAALDAPSSGFLPAELADDEIVITQWLADDLGVKHNDSIALTYFVMGERRQLIEKSRTFEVLDILPMSDPAVNASWTPDFPGLTDQANCRDWKPGFAIDNARIRDVDEEYWDQYRGTPKAFVNITVGQQIWGNRWGSVTGLRYPPPATREAVAAAIHSRLEPPQFGFQIVPLREQALAATDAPIDFGQLFLGFSFFLIAAAGVLTGLLFVFTLEQRNAEAGTLLALGLPPRLVRRLLLGEGAVLAVVGAVLGTMAAVAYTHLVLRALGTVWQDAVGAVDFVFHAAAGSILGGAAGAVGVALCAMAWASRRQLRTAPTRLLAGEASDAARGDGLARAHRIPWISLALAVAAVLMVAAGGGSPGLFFGGGALLLIAGVGASRALLRAGDGRGSLDSARVLARRNTARRLGRSVATIAVLASGVFMVVAVDAFRQRPGEDIGRRDSGTGGFSLVAESALPIYEDLNSAQGRDAYALDEEAMKGVRVVPMRVRAGDDASCLNLNRALQPRLLGVKPEELAAPPAFAFASREKSWAVLDESPRDGAIPAVVDANTLTYALQKKLGDTIEYQDERGRTFSVRLAAALRGSMLQGDLLIAERHFIERFPGAGGYRFFLIDTPAPAAAEVASELSRALQDRGLEAATASARLAAFHAVENTYLSIFQALGGLGLLLGTAGLAIVVARNVLERRREFGLLEAVGFRPGQLRGLVFAEHRWLIVLALAIGAASACLAVWPQLIARTGTFPWRSLAALLSALVLGCVFWTWLATRAALRGSQLPALRNE
jgi:hypothetical protein